MVALVRSSAGIAVAMAVMNLGTYAFQMVAARLLGPSQYGAVASLMALLMVLAVVQLGLQATAARRISADPDHVAAIEQTVLRTTWIGALGLGAVALAAAPLVADLLRLESLLPAVLVGLAVVPVTVMGGQAGVLQGERRWLPLSVLYVAAGVPRVVFGGGFLLISPTETSAMLGVLIASWAPVAVGAYALRSRRRTPRAADESALVRDVRKETIGSSMSLLAFTALSSLDVVVARSVLDEHDAGLYAAGLIVTKVVLFLPQFAVVILYPSMSTDSESRTAVLRGLAFLSALGALAVLGVHVLREVALVFVGGDDYAEVTEDLWLFAVLGALLSVLQLLVYAGLAKRGTATKYVVGAGVLALVVVGSRARTITDLATAVAIVDAVVVVVLLGLQMMRHRRADPAPAEGPRQDPTPGSHRNVSGTA